MPLPENTRCERSRNVRRGQQRQPAAEQHRDDRHVDAVDQPGVRKSRSPSGKVRE